MKTDEFSLLVCYNMNQNFSSVNENWLLFGLLTIFGNVNKKLVTPTKCGQSEKEEATHQNFGNT